MLWNEWRSFTSSIKLWHFQNLNGLEDLDRKCFFKQMGTILLSWQPLIGQIYQPISLNSLSSCHACILLNLFRILHKKKKYIYIYIYLFPFLFSLSYAEISSSYCYQTYQTQKNCVIIFLFGARNVSSHAFDHILKRLEPMIWLWWINDHIRPANH